MEAGQSAVESTALGARVIMEHFEEYDVPVEWIVNRGGISDKNPLVIKVYADVRGRPLMISKSVQTCALGAAVSAAVVAGSASGGHGDFSSAIGAKTAVQDEVFEPIPEIMATYNRLYRLYRRLHDTFGEE